MAEAANPETEKTARGKFSKMMPAAAAGLGSLAGTYMAVQSLSEVPPWVQKLIETRGLDFITAVLVIVGAFYFLQALTNALAEIAIAQTKMAVVMDRIAGQETRTEQVVAECLINDRILVQRVEGVSREVQDVQKSVDQIDTTLATELTKMREAFASGIKVSQ